MSSIAGRLALLLVGSALGCDDASYVHRDAGRGGLDMARPSDLGGSDASLEAGAPSDLGSPEDVGPSPPDLGTLDLGTIDLGTLDLGPIDAEVPDTGDPCDRPATSAPDTPRLLAPHDGASWGSALAPATLSPRFRWRVAEDAGCYELQWGTDCDATDLAGCDLGSSISATTAATEHTPAAPLAVSVEVPVGARYYWRVRACNAEGCSAWSRARYLDVGRLPDDIDGDGDSEVIVGCRGCDAIDGTAPSIGALFVYDGGSSLDASPLRFEHPGRQTYSRFGQSVAAGDIDGDGFADVVVGAPTESAAGPDAGALYWLRGSPDGLVVSAGSYLRVVSPSPERAQGYLGGAVAIAGDVDADGDRDVVVSAAGEAPDGAYYSGAVYLLRGSPTGLTSTPELLARPAVPPSSKVGFSLAGVGDLDGDGLSDVVAGAAGYSPPDTGAPEVGRLVVWRGAEGAALAMATFVDPPDPMPDDLFGSAVSGGLDVDDDGLSDVIVGADQRNAGAGRVRLAYGDEAALLVVGPACRSRLLRGAMFGGAVLALGDLDLDGRTDLFASAWNAGGPVFRVGPVARDRSPVCTSWFDSHGGGRVFDGLSMARADVDGDGDQDLLVGCPAVGPFPDDPLPEGVRLYRARSPFDTTPEELPVPYPMGTRPQELGYSVD